MSKGFDAKKYIDKLIQAFESKGIYYEESWKRIYSEKNQKFFVKHKLQNRDDKEDMIESFSRVELLKFLVRRWNEFNGKSE